MQMPGLAPLLTSSGALVSDFSHHALSTYELGVTAAPCPPSWGAQNHPLSALCLVLATGVAGPDSPTRQRGEGSLWGFLFEAGS